MALCTLGGGLDVAHTPGGLSRPCRIPFGDRADGKSGYDRELDAIPAFLGSSFAFISPVFVVMGSQGYPAALGGFIAAGLFFMTVALNIGRAGIGWLDFVFPPAAMGAIVAIIGLELAPGPLRGLSAFGGPVPVKRFGEPIRSLRFDWRRGRSKSARSG